MSRIGNLQDFLDAVGPHEAPAATASPAAPAEPELELELESVPVSTGLGSPADPPVELDAVTAVTRFPRG